MEFQEKYDGYLKAVDQVIDAFCNALNCKPKVLNESLKYTLMSGGKRFRPVLMYAVGELLGVDFEKLENFALATELIHTYSLIHDDLPAMDNDDFRRGKPSSHKKFGEANAILAGDGLLNTAYSVLLRECRKGGEYVAAAETICDCAGVYGMIAGQSADIMYENDKCCDEAALNFIYLNKTSKMIVAPCVVPSILCGGKYYPELKAFGENLGLLFQFKDDVLDVEGSFDTVGKSIGKDKDEGKYTAVNLYGLDNCKLRADLLADRCLAILEGLEGDRQFLSELVAFVRDRNK